jgi:hypothetical protein
MFVVQLPWMLYISVICGGLTGFWALKLIQSILSTSRISTMRISFVCALAAFLGTSLWVIITGTLTKWWEGWLFVVWIFVAPSAIAIGVLLGVGLAFWIRKQPENYLTNMVMGKFLLFLISLNVVLFFILPTLSLIMNSPLPEYRRPHIWLPNFK